MPGLSYKPASDLAPVPQPPSSANPAMFGYGNAFVQDQMLASDAYDPDGPGVEIGSAWLLSPDEIEAERQEYDDFFNATHSVKDFSLGGHGDFDLTYDPSEYEVVVTVRLGFEFGPEGAWEGGEGEGRKWDFRDDFIKAVHDTWSWQHVLQCNHEDGSLEAYGDGWLPPVWSGLSAGVRVDPVWDDKNPQWLCKIEALEDPMKWKESAVHEPTPRNDQRMPGARTATFDTNDLTAITKDASPEDVKQRAVVHEFGHMLGNEDEYSHDDKLNGDSTRQGATVDGTDNPSVMAGGEIVEQPAYEPIKQALNAACNPVQFDIKD